MTTRVALVHYEVNHDSRFNLERGLAAVRQAAAHGARLVVFPELALTPFFPQRPVCGPPPLELAESVPGPTTDAFAALARELEVVIVLNLDERENFPSLDN